MTDLNNTTETIFDKLTLQFNKGFDGGFDEVTVNTIVNTIAELAGKSMLGSYYAGLLQKKLVAATHVDPISSSSEKLLMEGYLVGLKDSMIYDDGFNN